MNTTVKTKTIFSTIGIEKILYKVSNNKNIKFFVLDEACILHLEEINKIREAGASVHQTQYKLEKAEYDYEKNFSIDSADIGGCLFGGGRHTGSGPEGTFRLF